MRPFLVENVVLALAMLVFIPVFFFASEYAQIALGKGANGAGLFLLFFFIGFAGAAQVGGRMLDARGAKRPVVLGCLLGAVGFWLWVEGHRAERGQPGVVRHPVGRGAGDDARTGDDRCGQPRVAPGLRRGDRHHADGAQLRRALGLAILGLDPNRPGAKHVQDSLVSQGVSSQAAAARASAIAHSSGGGTGAIPHFVRADFAAATRVVLFAMAIAMAVAAVVAFLGLRRGVQTEAEPAPAMES